MSALQNHSSAGSSRLTRRRALGMGGAAVAAGTIGSVAGPLSLADARSAPDVVPVPRPIPGGIPAPPIDFIHFYLPGPAGATTPVLGLPGGGLDVEPSTITDFRGEVAFAVLAGTAQASDGNSYPIEVDVRVMDGEYLDASGVSHEASFSFL